MAENGQSGFRFSLSPTGTNAQTVSAHIYLSHLLSNLEVRARV